MQATSVPNLQHKSSVANRVSFNQTASQQIQQSTTTGKAGQSSQLSLSGDTTSRMSQLGKALKRLLDPTQDRLLPGYAELIQLVKATTVAAREERKEEERLYYEAQITRFSKDKRQLIKKDDQIREFLVQKKIDIYALIEHNMSKLKVFPENHSLVSNQTAEEKIWQIQQSLKNPQLEILARFVGRKKNDCIIPSHLSPISRKKMQQARQRHASQEAKERNNELELSQAQGQSSDRSQRILLTQYETRDIQLSDLATVLEDLEVIELETAIGKQEFNVPGSKRSDDESISRNKQMLEQILERPSLSELIMRSVEKNDLEAARKAELKLNLMQRHSIKNLAVRVNAVVNLPPTENDMTAGPNIQGHSNQQKTQPLNESSPSRRALNTYKQVVKSHIKGESKYVPFEKLMPGRTKNLEDDRYMYTNIEAILHTASSKYKFNDDIDNSEEEELTDDELRIKIKERKNKEKSRRDDLTTVKAAALQTASNVEALRQKIGVNSIVTGAINLDALRRRQAKLREQIDNSDAPQNPRRVNIQNISPDSPTYRFNERSGDHMIRDDLEGDQFIVGGYEPGQIGQSYSQDKLMQDGYEPCEEEDDDVESSGSSYDSVGRRKPKVRLDPVAALERQMQKYQTCDTATPDTLDLEKMKQVQFKASFISHICAVKDRKEQYKKRLRTFDHKKSTKGTVVNQPYHENRIYKSVHRNASSKSALDHSKVSASQIPTSVQVEAVDGNAMHNKRSQSSFTTQSVNLSMSKNPTLTQNKVNNSSLNQRGTVLQSPSGGGVPFNPTLTAVIQQTQSQPTLASPSGGSTAHKRLVAQKQNRGLDLSCVNSSQLVVSPSPMMFQQASNSRQPLNVEGNQAQMVNSNSGEVDENGVMNASEVPQVQNQFSMLSLRIVLSPRGHKETDSIKAQNQSSENTQQKTYRLVPKNQESTVTVLGKTHQNNENGSEIAANQFHMQSNKAILNKDDSSQNFIQDGGDTFGGSLEGDKNLKGLYQGNQQSGKSLLGTRSSASQQLLEQKLQGGNSAAALNSPSMAQLLMNAENNFGLDNGNIFSGQRQKQMNNHATAGSQEYLPSPTQLAKAENDSHNQQSHLTQHRQQKDDASPGGSRLGAETILQPADQKSSSQGQSKTQKGGGRQATVMDRESPTASKLNLIELPQQPITHISFEKSGQNKAAAASREQTAAANVNHSNIAVGSKFTTTHTAASPHFMISPKEAGTEDDEERKKFLLVIEKQNPSFQGAQILPTTNFQFPLHSDAMATLDEMRQQIVVNGKNLDQDQRQAFKDKMLRRFGGTTSYWQAFAHGINQQQDKNEMNRTFQEPSKEELEAEEFVKMIIQSGKNSREGLSRKKLSKFSKSNSPSTHKSIVAQEVILDQNRRNNKRTKVTKKQQKVAANMTHIVFEDMLRARTNLLGPTEYLQLSSQGSSNTPDMRSRQRQARATIRQTPGTMKNVVKLELNERQNSNGKNKSPKGGALKNNRGINTAESHDGRSDLAEGIDSLGGRLQPVMVDDSNIGNKTPAAIQEEQAQKFIQSPIKTRIQVSKKSMDSYQNVQTQGMASHLRLHDAATSPVEIHTKPNSPLEVSTPNNGPIFTPYDQKKQPTKGLSNMGLNRLYEKLDTQPHQLAQQMNPQFIAANNMRKLSISILTSNQIEESQEKSSALRISPENSRMHKNSTSIFAAQQAAMEKVPSPRITAHIGRNELTPHLQSTNVKIALQKEKSKRMIQILSKKQSGMQVSQPNGSGGSSEIQKVSPQASQNFGNIDQKQSSPFLQPTQIDLGLHLDKDFQTKTQVRATQEFKPTAHLLMNNKGTSKMSNHNPSTIHRLGQSTEDATSGEATKAHAGEYAMDSQGQFVKVIKRTASQLENPLLDCSEEDEKSHDPVKKRSKKSSMPQSMEGKRMVALVGSGDDQQEILNHPEQMINKNKSPLDHHRLTSAGQTYQPLGEQARAMKNPLTDADSEEANHRMMNQTMTPIGNEEKLQMGLGGEDIITDGASQIRIEQDIREMQGLLPPLLETASTKQFFQDDTIRLQDENQKKNSNLKKHDNESVPLQYIRDSSKMSDHKQVDFHQSNWNKSKLMRLEQQRKKLAGERSPGSNTNFNKQEMMTTGIQYSPTPLSVLQENPLQSDLVHQSMFRRSEHGSGVSISVIKKQKSARGSQQIGPYLKSFTQRIKLPNLNRSQYASLGKSVNATPKRALEQETPAPQAHNPRSNARSSVVTKQNNVFTTKDSELAHGETIMTKHMANNFRVKIKNQLHNSVERSLNRTHYGTDGHQKFIDLHQSARNTGTFGMQVSSVLQSGRNQGKEYETLDTHGRLKSQILVYGGGHGGIYSNDRNNQLSLATESKLGMKNSRNVPGYMHQTLTTQVLMPPIDITPQMKKQLPPKSLLFKGKKQQEQPEQANVISGALSGAKTSRVSPKQPSQLASYNTLGVGRVTPGIGAASGGIKAGADQKNAAVKQKAAQDKIESGSMELSPQKRVRLAADIHESLVPVKLPPMEGGQRVSIAETGSSDQESKKKIMQDASTRVKMGSINPDQPYPMSKGSHALKSQGSSVRDAGQQSIKDSSANATKNITDAGETRRHSAEVQDTQKALMTRSQASEETLKLVKQNSIVTVIDPLKNNKDNDVSQTSAKQGLQIHMFDESKDISPQKTETGWNKGGDVILMKKANDSNKEIDTREEDCQTNFEGLQSHKNFVNQLMQMENMIAANKTPIDSTSHLNEQKQPVVERNKVIINQSKQLNLNEDGAPDTRQQQTSRTQQTEEDEMAVGTKLLNSKDDGSYQDELMMQEADIPHLLDLKHHLGVQIDENQHEETPPIELTNEQKMFQEHQFAMSMFKQQQAEQSVIERFYTKQPISYSGQNDISNSVWVDTEQYAAKKRPDLMRADLIGRTRNGKHEIGASPFVEEEFIRMDGQTVRLQQAQQMQAKARVTGGMNAAGRASKHKKM